MALTVGELSRASGVTVRTLHHYDEIGLCRPSQRTAAGYRLYDDADVLRLQQVLVLRELGLPLDEIASAIDEAADRAALLRRHREALRGEHGIGRPRFATSSIRARRRCRSSSARCM